MRRSGETRRSRSIGWGIGATLTLVLATIMASAAHAAVLPSQPARSSLLVRTEHYAPWVIALLAVFGFVFKDAVQRWSSAAADAIGQRIWRRIAGSHLMRRTALKRYRRSLAKKVRKIEVVFRRNKPLDMSRIFIPLKVAAGAEETQHDADEVASALGRIVVVGSPGAGKSILLRHIAYRHACPDPPGAGDGPVPVPLDLHRLAGTRPDTVDEVVLDELTDVFARNGFPNARRFLERNLEAGTLLLLLDGLDEVQSGDRARVAAALCDLLERYPRTRAVITCRNAVYKGEFDAVADATFELVEFSDQQVHAFLASWAPEMPSNKSVGQLVLALRENPRLMVLARNPLMLTIIAHLYTESPTYQLPNSRAAFYQESSDILLRHWHERQNDFGASEKRAALRQLALKVQESEGTDAIDRRTIPMDEALAVLRVVLQNLGKDVEDAQPMLDEIVERSGLLLAVDGGERYQFAHLTFQEYFAAERLLSQLEELMDNHQRDPDTWREVVKIWCGLVDDATEAVERLWASGAELTALEAVAEARGVDTSCASRIVGTYIARLRAGEESEAVERALGATAANVEARGRQVLEALKQALDEATTADQIASVARAIAASNLPVAAQLLARRYDRPEVRAPLEQLGDLAVDPLAMLAGAGSRDALEGLMRIGTAAASVALAEVLWNGPPSFAIDAAWYLGSLLSRNETCRALAGFHVASGVPSRRWIWEPFAEGDSGLALTVGRIAELIATTPDEQVPDEPFGLDPRLAVPLAIVGSNPITNFQFRQSASIGDLYEAANQVVSRDDFRSFVENRQPQRYRTTITVGDIVDGFLDIVFSGRSFRAFEAHRPAFRAEAVSIDGIDHFTRTLVAVAPAPDWWRRVFLSLTPLLRLELIRRTRGSREVTSADWSALRRPVDYSFGRSIHRRCVQALFTGASVVGALGASYVVSVDPTWAKALAVIGTGWLVSGCFWLFTGLMADEPSASFDLIFGGVLFAMLRDWGTFSILGFTPALGVLMTVGLVSVLGLSGIEAGAVWAVWGLLVGVVSWRAGRKRRASINPVSGLELSPAWRSASQTAIAPDAEAVVEPA